MSARPSPWVLLIEPTNCASSGVFGAANKLPGRGFPRAPCLVHERELAADIAGKPHLVSDKDKRHARARESLDHAHTSLT